MPKALCKLARHVLAFAAVTLLSPTTSLSAASLVTPPGDYFQGKQYGIGILKAASNLSDQIQTKVIVTKRRRHGNFMDVDFRIEFSSVPQGKEYIQCFWDMGMKRDGAKPGCLEPGTVWPDQNGKMVSHFEVTDFVQGEWIQITIRSTDGEVQKSARFTPFK